MNNNPHSGLLHFESKHSLDETLQRLEALLRQQGVQIFARIDHSGEAQKIGLSLRPTKLLIFGSPKAGTPVMQAAPTAAIDLPLKALVWQDDDGRVWVTANDPVYLQLRHNIPADLVANLAGVNVLLTRATT